MEKGWEGREGEVREMGGEGDGWGGRRVGREE